jgi:predicted Zn-dependent peptidase
MSSRLFQHIREQLGVCYYIGASHASDIDDGVFMIRSGIDKTKFEFTIDAINKELKTIVNEGISDDELIKAQGFLTGQTLMGIESSDEMAEFV